MGRKLDFKLCPLCDGIIYGIRRQDRKSFYYPRRCKQCANKVQDKELYRYRISQKMKGQNNPRYRPIGSKRLHSSGKMYWQIKIADPNIWVYEHRYIMERELNRPLKSSEFVHHIDGNGLNNSRCNLQLISISSHNKNHFTITTWARNFDECRRCHSTKYHHVAHGLCAYCHPYVRHHNQLKDWIN